MKKILIVTLLIGQVTALWAQQAQIGVIEEYRQVVEDQSDHLYERKESLEKALNKALIDDPTNSEINYFLGLYHFNLLSLYENDEFDAYSESMTIASEKLSSAYQYGYRSSKLSNCLGELQLSSPSVDTNKAREYFDEAIQLDPFNAKSHENLSYLFLHNDQNESALTEAVLALMYSDENSFSSDSLYSIGYILINLDRHDDATVLLERGKALNPENCGFYECLLSEYLMLGKIEKAEENAFQLIKLLSNVPSYISRIEQYYSYNDQTEHLDRLLLRLLKDDNLSDEARGYIWYNRIYTVTDDNGFPDVLAYLETASKYFEKVYKPDHYIFEEMERNRDAYNEYMAEN